MIHVSFWPHELAQLTETDPNVTLHVTQLSDVQPLTTLTFAYITLNKYLYFMFASLTKLCICHFRFLPRDMKNKKTKTILCVRYPKDTAVSFFNHMRGLKFYGYGKGKWENFLKLYLEGKCEFSKNGTNKHLNILQNKQEKLIN